MRRKMRRSAKIVWRSVGTVSFIFSVGCTFLGIAPDRAIEFIVGPEWMARLQYVRAQVLGMTAEQGRWALVILGDLSFAVAVFLFVFVYYANRMAKTYATMGEVSDLESKLKRNLTDTEADFMNKLQNFEEKLRTKEVEINEQLAEARRKERRAKTLHDAAYEMLKKIRHEKTSQ